jgi:DNA-binding MarR family transcriptional regulator
VQAVLGAETSSARLLVQIPGVAARMSRAVFTEAMGSMPSFRSLMYAYVQAFLEQVMVSVACNGAHSLKQRLARWLLMMRDRDDHDTLQISQNLLAEMLGVQRPTITNAARELERAGLIARGRRQISILDREGLTEASCECYQLVRARLTFPKHTRKKRSSAESVIYITDKPPQRADNQNWWEADSLIRCRSSGEVDSDHQKVCRSSCHARGRRHVHPAQDTHRELR